MGEHLLRDFETYGWTPDDSLSDDENMMDLVLLLTRSSKLKQGSMACLLLRPPSDNYSLLDRIQSVANNQELFQAQSSDIHAEIAALGDAARHGRPTDKCTAYITMPPCRKCITALYAAGIVRAVSTRPPPAKVYTTDLAQKITMEAVANEKESRARIQVFVDAFQQKLQSRQETGKKRPREGDNHDLSWFKVRYSASTLYISFHVTTDNIIFWTQYCGKSTGFRSTAWGIAEEGFR